MHCLLLSTFSTEFCVDLSDIKLAFLKQEHSRDKGRLKFSLQMLVFIETLLNE
jgi:hypothetical protein